MDHHVLHVNGERLWGAILEMARIGVTAGGGCNRLAFSPLDDAARRLFRDWCKAAGMSVQHDVFANMFARRPGTDDLPPILIGSHLDTQPTGGRFDGILGVMAALEAIRVLDERGIATRHPIVIVNWTNEEGAIVRPMMGSEVFTGAMTLETARGLSDHHGRSVGAMLDAMDMGPGDLPAGFPLHAYLELHIEQGPILESTGEVIGVVGAGIGFRRWALRFSGQDAHAGPTPMEMRRDAMVAAARTVLCVDAESRAMPGARGTCGVIATPNGSQVTVASQVDLTVDLRHAEQRGLDLLDEKVFAQIDRICAEARVEVSIRKTADSSVVHFDEAIQNAIARVAGALALPRRTMVSGAGHDACNIARAHRAGMIFVPSAGGLSHNEAEFTSPEHCTAGADVLLNTVLHLDQEA